MRVAALAVVVTLAGCECDIFGGCRPLEIERHPARPPTVEALAGTACLFGEAPFPDCQAYRSRILADLCGRGHASPEECRTLRRPGLRPLPDRS